MKLKIDLEKGAKGSWFATIESLRVFASGETRDRAIANAKAGAFLALCHELETGKRAQRGLSSVTFRVAA